MSPRFALLRSRLPRAGRLGFGLCSSERRGTRGAAALLAAIVLVSGAMQPASEARAAEVAPAAPTESVLAAEGQGATSEEEEDLESTAILSLAPAEPVLQDDAANYVFSVNIRNPGANPIPEGVIELSLDQQQVTERAALSETEAVPGTEVAVANTSETPAESEQALTITVPRAEWPLTLSHGAGVYRVQATLRVGEDASDGGETQEPATAADETDVASSAPFAQILTSVIWREAGTADPVQLSTIVPFVLPEDVRAFPTPTQLDELAPRFAELLETAEEQRATLAIDPRIIAGIRAYGDDAPQSAQDLLSALTTTVLPSFLLQFGDADPAAQAALEFEQLLQPTDLSFATRFGDFPEEPEESADVDDPEAGAGRGDGTATDRAENGGGESAGAGSAGASETRATGTGADEADEGGAEEGGILEDSTEEGDAPPAADDPAAVPTLEELLAWPAQILTAWPATGAVDAETLKLLRDSGYESIVLDAANVDHDGGPLVELGGMDGIVGDTALEEAMRESLAAESETERAAGFARGAALTALAAKEGDVTGLVLALDRGAMADAEDPGTVLEQFGALEWIAAVPIEGQGAADDDAALRAGGTLDGRLELLRSAVGREADVEELSILVDDPEYLTGYQRSRLLTLFATRHAAPDAPFEQVAERFRQRDAELTEGVHVITIDHTQLVGTSSQVPVQVHNGLPFDITVTAEVLPSSAGLTVLEKRFEAVRVPADSNETLLVPVHSRVASGESGLAVTLTDVAGSRSFFFGILPITINSAVETIALWSLGVLAALLLGFGIWRSLRRHRRQRTDAEQAELDE